jgi:hypothetical protein
LPVVSVGPGLPPDEDDGGSVEEVGVDVGSVVVVVGAIGGMVTSGSVLGGGAVVVVVDVLVSEVEVQGMVTPGAMVQSSAPALTSGARHTARIAATTAHSAKRRDRHLLIGTYPPTCRQ